MTKAVDLMQRAILNSPEGHGPGYLQERVHYLESTLAQRQEEIAQLRVQLENERRTSDDRAPQAEYGTTTISHLRTKLADTGAWVFKLARNRHELELRNAMLDRKLMKITKREERLSSELSSLTECTRTAEAGLQSDLAALRSQLVHVLAEREQLAMTLHLRQGEIDKLNALIRHKDEVVAVVEYRAEWLRRMLSVLTRDHSRTFKSRLLALLPAFLSHRRKHASLKEAGLFDGETYLALHRDVAKSKIDPLRHYVNYGISEGRAIGE